jgi:hypothetical protein
VPVEILEAIRMFLAYSCHKQFRVYQMDVNSSFINGDLKEEVYMEQREGFQLSDNIDLFYVKFGNIDSHSLMRGHMGYPEASQEDLENQPVL